MPPSPCQSFSQPEDAGRIDRRDERPVYQQIQDFVQQEIQSGRWKPGDPIDSAPKLARHLGVSYATICRSIRSMVAQGVLVTRNGAGTYVSETALRRSVLWINGIGLLDGDISPYFLQSMAIGEAILRKHHFHVDSVWIDRSDDPLAYPNLARGEIMHRYHGAVLQACHPEHMIRPLIGQLGMPLLDLSSDGFDLGRRQAQQVCGTVARSLTEMFSPWAAVGHQVPLKKVVGGERLALPAVVGTQAHEQWGYRLTCWRLDRAPAPRAWLVLDDFAARGVTRAIMEHRLRTKDFASPWPKVVVVASDRQVFWHGFPVDYILTDTRQCIEVGMRPFLDRLLGQPARTYRLGRVVRHVPWDSPDLAHLDPRGEGAANGHSPALGGP